MGSAYGIFRCKVQQTTPHPLSSFLSLCSTSLPAPRPLSTFCLPFLLLRSSLFVLIISRIGLFITTSSSSRSPPFECPRGLALRLPAVLQLDYSPPSPAVVATGRCRPQSPAADESNGAPTASSSISSCRARSLCRRSKADGEVPCLLARSRSCSLAPKTARPVPRLRGPPDLATRSVQMGNTLRPRLHRHRRPLL